MRFKKKPSKKLKDQSGIDVKIHGPTLVQQFFLSDSESRPVEFRAT